MIKATEKAFRLPDTITGWVLLVFGSIALIAGLLGVINPGIGSNPDGPVAAAFMFSISLSAICNGVLHLMAVMSGWTKFPYYAITARMILFAGYTALVISGDAPASFKGGAVFEVAGAVIIAISIMVDNYQEKEECGHLTSTGCIT